MPVVVSLLGVMLFAPALLGFLLWLGHLEDTLQRDVGRAMRRPEPPPILAIPVRSPLQPTLGTQPAPQPQPQPAAIPEQRAVPEVELSGPDAVPAT
jgi:hypothetical protein